MRADSGSRPRWPLCGVGYCFSLWPVSSQQLDRLSNALPGPCPQSPACTLPLPPDPWLPLEGRRFAQWLCHARSQEPAAPARDSQPFLAPFIRRVGTTCLIAQISLPIRSSPMAIRLWMATRFPVWDLITAIILRFTRMPAAAVTASTMASSCPFSTGVSTSPCRCMRMTLRRPSRRKQPPSQDYYGNPPARTYSQPPPKPEADYIFVRRDGTLIFAIAYTWINDRLQYVTEEGLRRTVPANTIDLDATQQFNDQRGVPIRLPA